MKWNFNVTAKTFATICLVISAAGFFSGHSGVGWGFAALGAGAFVFSQIQK